MTSLVALQQLILPAATMPSSEAHHWVAANSTILARMQPSALGDENSPYLSGQLSSNGSAACQRGGSHLSGVKHHSSRRLEHDDTLLTTSDLINALQGFIGPTQPPRLRGRAASRRRYMPLQRDDSAVSLSPSVALFGRPDEADVIQQDMSDEESRRGFLRNAVGQALLPLAASSIGLSLPGGASAQQAAAQVAEEVFPKDFVFLPVTVNGPTPTPTPTPNYLRADGVTPLSPRPLAYQILPTDPPTMQPMTSGRGETNMLKKILRENELVLLGEHHDQGIDQELALRLVRELRGLHYNLALGLEMVQLQFQPALDRYISREVADLAAADEDLRRSTEWDDRWPFPFENYLPLFHWARQARVPLVAANTDSEAQLKVQLSGFEGLRGAERQRYVPDVLGFLNYTNQPGFKMYADRVIRRSFEYHNETGVLGPSPDPNLFFAARVLWDETMANAATKWLEEHPRHKMVLLAGSDHVKYGYGIQARAERLGTDYYNLRRRDGKFRVASVLLNPTAEESYSYIRRLRLGLGQGARKSYSRFLADYIWFSTSPRVNLLTRMLNPRDAPYDIPEFNPIPSRPRLDEGWNNGPTIY